MIRALASGAATLLGARPAARPLHLHRFTWSGEDAFSSSSLYSCRCGVVRPGI